MTKVLYKINQKIWFMCENFACEEEISAIFYTDLGIYYWTGCLANNEELRPRNGYKQEDVFATKAELLKSL